MKPNEAHLLLAKLEEYFEVHIITQNVDDLHERGGSSRIIHLHGELKKARPIDSESEIIVWEKDLNLGDLNSKGVQLRPHIVWFGEMVPEMDQAVKIAETADIFLVIGTSMQVYPAASLIQFIPDHCEVFVIDPNLDQNFVAADHFLKTSATDGMRKLIEILLK